MCVLEATFQEKEIAEIVDHLRMFKHIESALKHDKP